MCSSWYKCRLMLYNKHMPVLWIDRTSFNTHGKRKAISITTKELYVLCSSWYKCRLMLYNKHMPVLGIDRTSFNTHGRRTVNMYHIRWTLKLCALTGTSVGLCELYNKHMPVLGIDRTSFNTHERGTANMYHKRGTLSYVLFLVQV